MTTKWTRRRPASLVSAIAAASLGLTAVGATSARVAAERQQRPSPTTPPAVAATPSGDEFHLSIGDPARKDRNVPIVLDAITEAATGQLITPSALAARLAGVRVVFIGENHTDIDFHRAQKRIIEELAATGRQVLIGLEMYPYTEQPFLDQWSLERMKEQAFLEQSHWYKNWGYNWLYYRDIFLFAQEHGLRMFAVNTPRSVVAAVNRKGLANLTPEESAHMPPAVDTQSAEHKTLFKAFFAGVSGGAMHTASMSEEQWDRMFAAQCTWDASMGYNAVEALKKYGKDDAIMVVLIGSGHVAYGLGIQRQAAHWFDGRMASVIPIAVADSDRHPRGDVRASYADFVWGLPPTSAPLYPALGLSTRLEGPFEVIDVEQDSVAAAAGFRNGDVLLTMDGTPLASREALNRLMAAKRWADGAVFTVRRDGQVVTLTAAFRRSPPVPAAPRPDR